MSALSQADFCQRWDDARRPGSFYGRLTRWIRSERPEIQDTEVDTQRGLAIMSELHRANQRMRYYDLVCHRFTRFVDARASAEKPLSVLEVGTGHGHVILNVAKHLAPRFPHARFAGMDIKPSFVDFARQNAAEEGVPVEFFAADAIEMAASCPRRFDFILMSMVAHHLKPFELYSFLQAILPLTSQGVFIMDVRRDFMNIVKSKLFSLWNSGYSDDFKADAIQSMRRGYTVGEIEWLLGSIPGPGRVSAEACGDVFLTAWRTTL